jgi:aminomethyltransferase
LGWITSFNKDFIMKDHHAAIKAAGPSKKLVGFEMIERGIPRQHYPILNAAGDVIGEVTSGTQSPTLAKGIGMGYVSTAHTDSEIFISIRDKAVKASIVKMPFL